MYILYVCSYMILFIFIEKLCMSHLKKQNFYFEISGYLHWLVGSKSG